MNNPPLQHFGILMQLDHELVEYRIDDQYTWIEHTSVVSVDIGVQE